VRLASEAARRSVSLVVAVGGDGTLNEVVNGLTDDDGQSRSAVGALMTGRGRDACRNLGVARDLREAARRLAEGREVRYDLGLARWPGGRRFFLASAGAGFDAMVAARAANLSGRGTIPYLRAVLASLRDYAPAEVTVEVDNGPRWSGRAAAVITSNGACFGGGMRIAPDGDPADGELDLVVLGALGRWELIRWLPTVYWGGHVRNPKVWLSRGRVIHVRAPTPLPIQIDGEVCGGTPLQVSVYPGALRLCR